MRHTAALLVATMIVVGCSAPAAQDDGSPSPPIPSATEASPTASAAPTPVATPVMTPVATHGSTPRPATAKELKIAWKADDPVGLPAVASVVDVVHTDRGYVLVTERYADEDSIFEAWWSEDGRTWSLAHTFPGGQRIRAATAGGPGFVLAAFDGMDAVVWTSNDGRDWQAVQDPSLHDGRINRLVSTASGVVAFGGRSASDDGRLWTSPDGFEWLAATNETGLKVARGLQAVGAYDGRAIAFVSEGETKPAAIWETTGRAEWTRTGSLPTAGSVTFAAGGPRGWIALGTNEAWVSADGRTFAHVKAGPDVLDPEAIADDSGFVVVGHVGSLPGETCGDQRPFAGHTWASTDGKKWQMMPVSREFKTAMVTQLLVVDRTLVGYGARIDSDAETFDVGRWTARLPDVSRAADSSDKGSRFQSCGG